MSDQEKLSRRDWFRLRPAPKPDSTTSSEFQSIGSDAPGMKPIADPVNHDGLDLTELPPMREAMLSVQDVGQLFTDIESLASDILLMQRSSRRSQATASRASTQEQLFTAKQSLLSGAITRLQIRYNWKQAAWIDTLEVRPDGYRLVRITHA